MLLYGYELSWSTIADLTDKLGIRDIEAEHIMHHLHSHKESWKGLIHGEKHWVGQRKLFFLGADDSFVCASGVGVHEKDEAPSVTSTDHDLVNAMRVLGVQDPGNPNWLMVVDFS